MEVRTVVVSSHANVSNMHGTRRQIIKVKNGKKDRNKNRQRFDVQSLGQFKSLNQMPRLEYPDIYFRQRACRVSVVSVDVQFLLSDQTIARRHETGNLLLPGVPTFFFLPNFTADK